MVTKTMQTPNKPPPLPSFVRMTNTGKTSLTKLVVFVSILVFLTINLSITVFHNSFVSTCMKTVTTTVATAPAMTSPATTTPDMTTPAMTTPAKLEDSRPNITVVCGPLYGDKLNPVGIVGWLKYYEERWGLTHVEFFITQKTFDYVRAEILQAMQERTPSLAVILNFHPLPNYDSETTLTEGAHNMFLNRALYEAQQRNSSYFLNFDADEFLVSKQFKTLDDMFATVAGNKPVISIPVFNVWYKYCENRRPTFDSMTYHTVEPVRTEKLLNDSIKMYVDPTRGKLGNQKYILRPSEIPYVAGVHEVVFDTEKHLEDNVVAFMTGRALDHQDIRVMHFRTGLGLHAEMDPDICIYVPERINNGTMPCPGFLMNGVVCKENFMEAEYMYEPTELNHILADYPFSAQAEHYYNNAVCYAERYPDLKQVWCKNADTKYCDAQKLWEHYNGTGTTENRIFGCQDSVKSPAV